MNCNNEFLNDIIVFKVGDVEFFLPLLFGVCKWSVSESEYGLLSPLRPSLLPPPLPLLCPLPCPLSFCEENILTMKIPKYWESAVASFEIRLLCCWTVKLHRLWTYPIRKCICFHIDCLSLLSWTHPLWKLENDLLIRCNLISSLKEIHRRLFFVKMQFQMKFSLSTQFSPTYIFKF